MRISFDVDDTLVCRGVDTPTEVSRIPVFFTDGLASRSAKEQSPWYMSCASDDAVFGFIPHQFAVHFISAFGYFFTAPS
jgi:hypothetical protein